MSMNIGRRQWQWCWGTRRGGGAHSRWGQHVEVRAAAAGAAVGAGVLWEAHVCVGQNQFLGGAAGRGWCRQLQCQAVSQESQRRIGLGLSMWGRGSVGGFGVSAMALSRAAVEGSVSGKPVGATTEAGHGAAVREGDVVPA